MFSLKLINRALRALNEEPIDAIDEDDLDDQPNAVIKLIGEYDNVVGRVLKAIGRGEFIGHVTLSPVEFEGDWKFPYRFQLPEDGLVFLDDGICRPGLEMAVELVDGTEQKVLRAKSNESLQISYVRRCDVDLLAPEVFEALGLGLAAVSAYQITASRDWSARIEDKAQAAIVKARGSTPTASDDTPQRYNRMGRVRGGAR